MEIELKGIDLDANIYDIYDAVELVLHSRNLYDHKDPRNSGRKPNFRVVPGVSRAGRLHNGTAILLVPVWLGKRLFRWFWDSPENNIVINDCALRLFKTFREIPLDVEYWLEKALYINPRREQLRKKIEETARQVRLRIAKVQFGVWHAQPDSPPSQRRVFSVEYEKEYIAQSEAYVNLVYEDNLICIDIGQRETEEFNYRILVKFSSICKLGIGYDLCRQPFIIFDLHVPPSFERGSYNDRVPEGIRRKGRYKTHDRISTLDDAHARIAPYAHQLRVILAMRDDLLKFEGICHYVKCHPLPTRVYRVDAYEMRLFRNDFIDIVSHWINSMDWKNAFQVEAYLRCGLLNTYDLVVSLQKPIALVIHDYASEASDLLYLFSVALRTRTPSETPSACLNRVRSDNPIMKPLKLAQGHILCHHVIITPSRMLLEGPYPTQSNRVIRHYQSHDSTLVERFVRVEFRDEDHLAYRWDGNVDGTWFLQHRIGEILREGFEIGGRKFEFLAYSNSSLREHAVWFVAPFPDPVEGDVNAASIRASLGDFSKLLRTPSKYAARIAQAFTATDPSVTIRSDQWEEQGDIGPHTDGVGTISPELAEMIWEKFQATGNLTENRVKPSAYQFRFLGYKGVVVVDSRLKGILMRLRESQRKFPVHNVERAEFEVARAFYHQILSISTAVMALDNLGVKRKAFLDLQDAAKRHIYLASDSLQILLGCLELIKVGLDFKDYLDKEAIGSAFFGRLVRDSMNHSLREMKFKARIPVPHSYQLVGVADEGQAYIKEGADPDKVFTLKENFCVQEAADKEPIYFKGKCLISRSPVIHPGDVQHVFAVGKPPEDKICFFRDLKNVVVLPAIGHRSLASCLAGGDLDGDTYDIYYGNSALLPPLYHPPADYPPAEVWTLDRFRGDATVDDICNFIIEYINSDVMGLLAHKHIIIADQSKDGVFDERCMTLATLCSKAVDYAKNGKPVDLRNAPRTLSKFKPDWDKAEVTGARDLDYYMSDRALGHLFREIDLYDPTEPLKGFPVTSSPASTPPDDAISRALAPLVRYSVVDSDSGSSAMAAAAAENAQVEGVKELHARYAREMRCICASHALVVDAAPDVRLTEEEVVLGTILANCTQPRWRRNRADRMRLHAEMLVLDVRSHVVPPVPSDGPGGRPGPSSSSSSTERRPRSLLLLRDGLRDAWAMWCWAQRHRDEPFIESFSLIALEVILDCLERLGALPND
ncbi:RNA dependent RNA polymerase-domain-containing protein [Russula compacta]|nr:RNA dependent RNA polymerase-domain-containing protein [Russula compacta]